MRTHDGRLAICFRAILFAPLLSHGAVCPSLSMGIFQLLLSVMSRVPGNAGVSGMRAWCCKHGACWRASQSADEPITVRNVLTSHREQKCASR
jgi:hypothetical protein